jgi:hypothetical protein
MTVRPLGHIVCRKKAKKRYQLDYTVATTMVRLLGKVKHIIGGCLDGGVNGANLPLRCQTCGANVVG